MNHDLMQNDLLYINLSIKYNQLFFLVTKATLESQISICLSAHPSVYLFVHLSVQSLKYQDPLISNQRSEIENLVSENFLYYLQFSSVSVHLPLKI